MANYVGHSVFNFALGVPVALFALKSWGYLQPSFLYPFLGAFAYGTLFMGPDLDEASKIKPLSIRGVLAFPFYSYALLFKHRAWSHMFIVGTLTRLVWLALYFSLFFVFFYQSMPGFESFFSFFYSHQVLTLGVFTGLLWADTCHIFLDKFS